ncbi:hypothetical protein LX36DRAFT_754630 [Colletotrichum falcatum]|nr:hypothetical protein LX36DRAFT_754630 [Colletotrichum falcatum]
MTMRSASLFLSPLTTTTTAATTISATTSPIALLALQSQRGPNQLRDDWMGRPLVVVITGYPIAVSVRIPNTTWSLRPLTEDAQDPYHHPRGRPVLVEVQAWYSQCTPQVLIQDMPRVLASNIGAAFVSLTPRLFHPRLLRVRQANAYRPVVDQKLHSSAQEFLRWSANPNTLIRTGKQLAGARQPSRVVSSSAS